MGQSTANHPPGSRDLSSCIIKTSSFSKQFAGASTCSTSGYTGDYTSLVVRVGENLYFCIVQTPTFSHLSPYMWQWGFTLISACTRKPNLMFFMHLSSCFTSKSICVVGLEVGVVHASIAVDSDIVRKTIRTYVVICNL